MGKEKINYAPKHVETEYTALNMRMEYIHNWVFHYDIYNDTWNAIPRDKYTEYWTKKNVRGVLKSKQIDTLFEIIHKTNGDELEIQKILARD